MSPALNDGAELHRINEAFAHRGEYVRTTEELANIAGVSAERMQLALNEQSDCLEEYRVKRNSSGALPPDRASRAFYNMVATIQDQMNRGLNGLQAEDFMAQIDKDILKPGRPRKMSAPAKNVSDASADRIERYGAAVVQVMNVGSFAGTFKRLSEDQKNLLAKALAHELAALPALIGALPASHELELVFPSNGPIRTGPRDKSARKIFTVQIRELLAKYGVILPAWQKSEKKCTDLVDFCAATQKACGVYPEHISLRTIAGAPIIGFRTLY